MDHHSEQVPLLSGGEEAPRDYLTRFRQAVGINASSTSLHTDLESARRSATGIYKEVITTQQWRFREYTFVEVIYYLALLANIIIGATLASLGQTTLLHATTITILGVVNSSTAGILALLKGQNLPDRLRKDEFEMRKVQDFIEEIENRLASGTMGGMDEHTFDDLIKEVHDRFNVARDTAEMNRPARYVHQIDVASGSERPAVEGAAAGAQPAAREGTGDDGTVQSGGVRQTKLALSSGKGKALVMS
jgi:hypothetical protein